MVCEVAVGIQTQNVGKVETDYNTIKLKPASKIESYIKTYIVPILPKVSVSRIYRLGREDVSDAEVLTAHLLCDTIRQFCDEICEEESLVSQQSFLLRAFLVEILRAGNCNEQALLAGAKLMSCPEVKSIFRVADSANDHTYLRLHDSNGEEWIYDPWLNPSMLWTKIAHIAEMTKCKLLTATPHLTEERLMKVGYYPEETCLEYSSRLKRIFEERVRLQKGKAALLFGMMPLVERAVEQARTHLTRFGV